MSMPCQCHVNALSVPCHIYVVNVISMPCLWHADVMSMQPSNHTCPLMLILLGLDSHALVPHCLLGPHHRDLQFDLQLHIRLDSPPIESRTPVSLSASASSSLMMAVYRPSPPHSSRHNSPGRVVEPMAGPMADSLAESYRPVLASQCSPSPRCGSHADFFPHTHSDPPSGV